MKKTICKMILVGLLANILPATHLLQGQSQPKISIDIEKKIKSIKKTVRALQVANLVIPGLIVAAGILLFVVASAFKYEFADIEGDQIFGHLPDDKLLRQLLKKLRSETLKELEKGAFWVAVAMIFITPIAAVLSFLGIGPATMAVAFKKAQQLEKIEEMNPGTLTYKQKIVLSKFRNLYSSPLARGIIKYFQIKTALTTTVNAAMQRRPELVTKIVHGNKRKTRKIVAQYIKSKWKTVTLQKSFNLLKKQPLTPKWVRAYQSMYKKLNKLQKNIHTQETNYPYLKTLEPAVQMYGEKINNILKGLTKLPPEPKKLDLPIAL